MKVLWISPKPVNYKGKDTMGSGGWISSMHTELKHDIGKDFELGIAFRHPSDSGVKVIDGTTFFPVKVAKITPIKKIKSRLFGEGYEDQYVISEYLKIIDKFQPDIIHLWGCEHFHITLLNYTNVKIVVHIQGLLMSCMNAMLPPGISLSSIKKSDGLFKQMLRIGNKRVYDIFKRKCTLENSVFSKVNYWIGRTHWDKSIVQFLSPSSNYFHCDEIMRDAFYHGNWRGNQTDKIIIQSNISNALYKGLDVILKTAKLLSDQKIDYAWNVCGVSSNSSTLKLVESALDIRHSATNINFMGMLPSQELIEMMEESDVYVHSSYIESGSNAITEAQLLGIPVIAQSVGGLPTTLKDDAGILVSANDPFLLAAKICEVKHNRGLSQRLSLKERQISHSRNSPNEIKNQLLDIYSNIFNSDGKSSMQHNLE